ncbi:hypothetical protein [Scytonema sp. PRP1]|uniref:hypothetical protein n=1 Tax=Scytonema sp. PRP1 TaxID=3120513 RepID=UPI00300C4C69
MRHLSEWIREFGYQAYVNYRQALIMASSKEISDEVAHQVYKKAECCWNAAMSLQAQASFLDPQGDYPYHERYDFEHFQEAEFNHS